MIRDGRQELIPRFEAIPPRIPALTFPEFRHSRTNVVAAVLRSRMLIDSSETPEVSVTSK